MSDTLRFPDGFLFGASISAYQTEGGNTNTDWWWWEHIEATPTREPSGDACDFYHRYREDVAMLAGFGLNSFRFGLEWARIEPAEGEFSRAELAHYRRILDACHEHGVVPVVTFHHFTVPKWLHDKGGIAAERFPVLFERYCDRAAEALGDRIGYACTINEPQGLGSSGWILGVNPPGYTDDREGAQRAVDNLLQAPRLGAAAIRARAGIPTGVTLALPDLQYEDGAEPGTSSLELESRVNDWFFELARHDDFIGVQTYTRFRYGPEGSRSPGHDWSDTMRELEETDHTTQMGYEYYPQALGGAIRRAHRSCPGVPILVTENGIATVNDEKRTAYQHGSARGPGLPGRGHRRPQLPLLVAARQLRVGVRLRAHVRPGRGRPPDPSAPPATQRLVAGCSRQGRRPQRGGAIRVMFTSPLAGEVARRAGGGA